MDSSQKPRRELHTHGKSLSNTAISGPIPEGIHQQRKELQMLFINEFLENWGEMVEKPIVKGKQQGFILSNGARIFFKEWRLTTKNRAKLARLYKRKGIK